MSSNRRLPWTIRVLAIRTCLSSFCLVIRPRF